MRLYCPNCGMRLRLLEISCPYCHQLAKSWGHMGIMVILAAAGIVILFEFIA